MSHVTEVDVADGHVRVKLGVLDAESRISVEAKRDLEFFPTFVPKEITVRWSGTSDTSIEYAEAFESALHEALHIAQHMRAMIANPNATYGAGIESPEAEIPYLPDYLVALYLLLHGETPYYLRSRALTGDENEGVVDHDGMVRMAIKAAKEMIARG